MMRPLRERFQDVFALQRRGERTAAFAMLEAMKAEALASTDAGERATFLQTWAGALDVVGRRDEALDAAKTALAIDLELWPEGWGTFATLHSIVLILNGMGRHDEAFESIGQLTALGEKLGPSEFAGAAKLAHQAHPRRGEGFKVKPLLERARFACETRLREERPSGSARFEVVRGLSGVALPLSALYLQAGEPARAERVIGPVTTLLAGHLDAPAMRLSLANAWGRLAVIARSAKAQPQERLLLRYAAHVLAEGRPEWAEVLRTIRKDLAATGGATKLDDPAPLETFRVVRCAEDLVVAHPLRGWVAVPREEFGGSFRFGDALTVSLDGDGRLLSVRPAPSGQRPTQTA